MLPIFSRAGKEGCDAERHKGMDIGGDDEAGRLID
jgi:hypothetical protein